VTGVLTAIYSDDFANRRSELVHVIRDEETGRVFRVRFEKEPAGLRSGARLTIGGRSVGSEIFVAACCDTAGATTNVQSTSNSTFSAGDQSTLVIVANFGNAIASCSVDETRDVMFTDPAGVSVAGLYLANSLGQVSLSGDVVGPYWLNDVLSSDTCDIGGWATQAEAQATAAGVNVSAYRHKVYVMPENSCDGAGYGSIGGAPSYAWIFSPSVACVHGLFAHELGHNLGMDHAATPESEYGDSTDPMDISGPRLRGVNAPHRQQLGWLGPLSPQLVKQNGTYDIAPLALDPTVATWPQVLMIPKPDSAEYYYLSYREPIAFDNYIDGSFYNLLSVHRYPGDGSPSKTYRLAGLADGQSFVDPVNGISVTQLSHDSTHTVAQVQFITPCIASTPAMALSPQTQSGAAGTSISYNVSITNYDPPACPASTFALSDAVPAGWTGTLSTDTVPLSPGSTGQATLTVTSYGGAMPGSYSATVHGNDNATVTHAVSGTVTYTVPDTVAPTAPSGLTAKVSQKLKQIQLTWNAAADNTAVAGYRIQRNNVAIGTSTTLGWNDQAVTAGTTYTYSIVAYDAAGNISPASNIVSVTMSGGGGGKKP
jgi:hypothetical protein